MDKGRKLLNPKNRRNKKRKNAVFVSNIATESENSDSETDMPPQKLISATARRQRTYCDGKPNDGKKESEAPSASVSDLLASAPLTSEDDNNQSTSEMESDNNNKDSDHGDNVELPQAKNQAGQPAEDPPAHLSTDEESSVVYSVEEMRNERHCISDISNPENSDDDNDGDDDLFYDAASEISEISDQNEMSEDDSSQSEAYGDSEDSDSSETSSHILEDQGENNGNIPLYPGSPITLHESLLAILSLATVERVSGVLLSKILSLIALHCPPNSVCKKTIFTFKKYFAKVGSSLLKFHYFCSNCIYPLKSKSSICRKCNKTETSFFLEIPIFHQIQALFQREHFFENLQNRFNPNRKTHPDSIDDIYDGDIYKEQMENGFLSDPNAISFMAYSDGVQIYKSSTFSVWPLNLVINELSYNQRILPKNILFGGLWFGKNKPNPNVFLRPLKQSLYKLSQNGLRVKLHDGSYIIVKGKLICFTCDLPAKSKFLALKQYNGFFGCCHCLTPGERYPTGPRSSVHVYPYNPNIVPRTPDQTKRDAEAAIASRQVNPENDSVNGVKGLSLLYYMLPDLIRCIAVDVMHGVFLGICRTLVTLWFSATYRNMPWTMYHSIDDINERLMKIKVPSFVQRFPRSLKDVALWKASEYKLFLLYYSVPVLQGIMENNYMQHHCKLISGIFLLSQDSISRNQLNAASQLLHSYLSDFHNLYDLRFLGINFHQLLHLPQVVQYLGPLWVYSCFFLENLIGVIGKFFHGTQHIALQICCSATTFMQLPILIDDLQKDSIVHQFCKSLLVKQSKRTKISEEIENGLFVVGTFKTQAAVQIMLSTSILLKNHFQIRSDSFCFFYRLKKNGIIYFSQEYSRTSIRKESTFVRFWENGTPQIGQILRFVRWSDCSPQCDQSVCKACNTMYFFVAEIFTRQIWLPHDYPDVRLSFLSKVVSSKKLTLVPVASLECLCFYYKVDGDEYIAVPINTKEIE